MHFCLDYGGVFQRLHCQLNNDTIKINEPATILATKYFFHYEYTLQGTGRVFLEISIVFVCVMGYKDRFVSWYCCRLMDTDEGGLLSYERFVDCAKEIRNISDSIGDDWEYHNVQVRFAEISPGRCLNIVRIEIEFTNLTTYFNRKYASFIVCLFDTTGSTWM